MSFLWRRMGTKFRVIHIWTGLSPVERLIFSLFVELSPFSPESSPQPGDMGKSRAKAVESQKLSFLIRMPVLLFVIKLGRTFFTFFYIKALLIEKRWNPCHNAMTMVWLLSNCKFFCRQISNGGNDRWSVHSNQRSVIANAYTVSASVWAQAMAVRFWLAVVLRAVRYYLPKQVAACQWPFYFLG